MRGGARVRRVFAEEMARRTRCVGDGGGYLSRRYLEGAGAQLSSGEYRDLVPALDSMSLEGVIAAVRQGKLREHRA